MTTARTGWRSHPIAATTALVLTALLMLLAHDHARSWADDYQANDNWANATVLASGSGSLYEFIQNATREPNEPLATGQHTVWFKWTAPFTGQAKFDTAVSTCGQNASMPTSITTWVGNSIKTLVLAGGANFNTTSGVTYSIAVNGTCGGTVGSLQLNWNPPAYADRGNAIVLPADAGTTWANNRGAAPVADSGFSVGSNGVRDSIIWFRWMPSVDGRAHVSTRGSSAENEIGAFYLDDQSKLTRLLDAPAANGSSDMDLAFDVVGNHQYWIAVGSPPFGPGVQPQGDIKLQWALNPPANDNLENAKGLGGHGTTIAGTNFRATAEAGEPSILGYNPTTSIWYDWQADQTGTATVETIGSKFDTLLAVHKGDSYPTLQLLGANDDINGALNRQSRVSFWAQQGQFYSFQVAGYNGATGSVQLELNRPANDDFANAQALNGPSGIVTGTTAGSTGEPGEPSPAGNAPFRTVWYTTTAPASGPATFTTWGSKVDTGVEIYTGTALNNLQSKGFNNDFNGSLQSKMNFNAVAGTKYYFAVVGVGAAEGDLNVQWAFARPANDDFANAQVLSGPIGGVFTNNNNSTGEPNEPNHTNVADRSIWYQYTPSVAGTAAFSTKESVIDTAIGVYTGFPATGMTPIATNNDYLGSQQSYVTFAAIPGQTYYIAVDGNAGQTGVIALDWTFNSPLNDTVGKATGLGGTAGVASGTTVGAIGEPGEPVGFDGARTIWYSITASVSGPATIDTMGTAIDTMLGVYLKPVGSLVQLSLNDDANGTPQSQVDFMAVAGTTYYIGVGGNYGQQGAIQLNYRVGDPTVSIGDITVAEQNGTAVVAHVPVTLSHPTSLPVTVTYTTANKTAKAPGDYTSKSGTATIAAGKVSGVIDIPITDDVLDEPSEQFTVTLTAPTNALMGQDTATVTITDDDLPPKVSVANAASITEGAAGVTTPLKYNVSLDAPSGNTVTVNWATSGGTATAGADYTAASGTVTFAPGETSHPVSVNVLGDALDEANETVGVVLSSPGNATIGVGTASGTITDDDPPPSIAVADVAVAEGNSGTKNMTFTVKLSAASGQQITVDFATHDGTATVVGNDYVAKTGTLVFAPGDITKTVNVVINGDTTVEANETLTLNLTNPVQVTVADGTAIGTITNDD